MKIGVIVESFREPLRTALASARREGVSGVQMYARANNGHDLIAMPSGERRALSGYIADLGLEVASICGDLGGHGFQDAAGNAERIELSRRIIDLCGDFSTRVMTTHIGVVPSRDSSPIYQEMVRVAAEVGRYAADRGVTLAIETGPEPPERLAKFIRDCGVPGIGVNLDPANLEMVCREDAVHAVEVLASWIVHTHAKDGVNLRPANPADVYHSLAVDDLTPAEQLDPDAGPVYREVPLGQGRVRWPEYLAALRKSGYDGFLTIEREVGETPAADIRLAVAFLKEQLQRLD